MAKRRKMAKTKRKEVGLAQELYEVEVILKARIVSQNSDDNEGYLEYLVKWAGYDSDQNSWEPANYLVNCTRLVDEFWDETGLKDMYYVAGLEVSASEAWIEQERAFFAQTYRNRAEKAVIPYPKNLASSSIHPNADDIEPGSSTEEEDLPSLKIVIPGIGSKKRKVRDFPSSDEELPQQDQTPHPQKIRKPRVSQFGYIVQTSYPVPSPATIPSDNPPILQTNAPQTDIAHMEPSEPLGGIRTKQRVSQGALVLTQPKNLFNKAKITTKPVVGHKTPERNPTLASLNSVLYRPFSANLVQSCPPVTNFEPIVAPTMISQLSMFDTEDFLQAEDLRSMMPPRFAIPTDLQDLYIFIKNQSHKHSYSIWSGNSTNKQNVETCALQRMLDQVKAVAASSRDEARVIFIHVGALSSVHEHVDLVNYRAKTPHIQFYSYGTCSNISPSLWIIQEIWPCGGIITFTPSAIYDDPKAVHSLILRISKHPCWASYILPSVLGSVVELDCGNENPVALLERCELAMNIMLEAVEAGNIALLQAPPIRKGYGDEDGQLRWLMEYASLKSPTKLEALKMCVKGFQEAKMSGRSIEAEVSRDLSQMEIQPAFITTYRRYIVIQSQSEADQGVLHHDGFEWITAANFQFRDHFFTKEPSFTT